ncbi:MAG: pitrilysin family protein, partial [Smithellaceae bacterium]|nr:pitrilysin family protein [Smithellaceae bacterium]
LPANKIELWARIESDRMTNPVFRDFYQERAVVMEERKQRIDSDPDGKLYEQFMAAAFTSHPYRNPILGWTTDMTFFSPSHTYDFFRRFYAPNNTIITLVGDFEPAATLKLIRKYFEWIPRQQIKMPLITMEPRQKGEKRIEVLFDANPKIIIGFHKPTLPSFDDYVFDMIEYILSGGRTSRFYKNLVEDKALAENVSASSSIPGSRYPNLFTIFASPRTPATPSELEKEIYAELDRLKEEPVPGDELEKIKNIMKAEFIRGLNSNSALASKLSYFEAIAGDYRYIINHIKQIDKITPQDIMETAKKYLIPENRTVATMKRTK